MAYKRNYHQLTFLQKIFAFRFVFLTFTSPLNKYREMTVRELTKHLAHFDQDLEVGQSGHFGEILNIEDVTLSSMREPFVELEIEYKGEEPD